MDVLTKEQRHKNMSSIKSKGSKIEKILAKILWKEGFRYRKNDSDIYGKPDFTFRGVKLAVFCDGEFWHGWNWEIKKQKLQTNPTFWHQKIERNIHRDAEVNRHLVENGWVVLRFWEKQIKKDPLSCVKLIEETICRIKTDKKQNVLK